mgnify:CR=1 FL=1
MNTNRISFFHLILLSCLSTVYANDALSQDVFINPDVDGNLEITWTIPPCTSPKAGWEDEFLVDQPYQIKYKKASALLWESVFYTSASGAFVPAADLNPGYMYKFKVKYYGQNMDCRGLNRVRELGVEHFYYNVAVFNETQIIPGRSKKIHGVAYDKCLYPYTWPGGSIETVRLFQWGCYNEDIKAFLMDELSGGRVRMQNQMLGQCIVPTPAFAGDYARLGLEMGVGACDWPNAIYIKQPAGGSVFRLVNEVNGRCLVPSGDADGAMLYQSPCAENDERQLFFFEDF